MLSREKVIEKLKTAFPPLECTPELQDYNSEFGFAVFDENDKIIVKKDSIPFTMEKEFSEEKLESLIAEANLQIQDKQNKK